MPAQPTNCYICKNTWLGAGPICDNCSPPITAKPTFIPWCSFCGGRHDEADCLAGAVAAQQQKQQEALNVLQPYLKVSESATKEMNKQGIQGAFLGYDVTKYLTDNPNDNSIKVLQYLNTY